jgi:hypothetical protein
MFFTQQNKISAEIVMIKDSIYMKIFVYLTHLLVITQRPRSMTFLIKAHYLQH